MFAWAKFVFERSLCHPLAPDLMNTQTYCTQRRQTKHHDNALLVVALNLPALMLLNNGAYIRALLSVLLC
jgi:hypothetical protein